MKSRFDVIRVYSDVFWFDLFHRQVRSIWSRLTKCMMNTEKIKENSWNAWWLYIETWFEEVVSRDSHEILKDSPGALLSHSWNFINTVFLRWLKQSLFEFNSNFSPMIVSEGFSSWCRLDQSKSVKIWNIDILRRKIVNCIFC